MSQLCDFVAALAMLFRLPSNETGEVVAWWTLLTGLGFIGLGASIGWTAVQEGQSAFPIYPVGAAVGLGLFVVGVSAYVLRGSRESQAEDLERRRRRDPLTSLSGRYQRAERMSSRQFGGFLIGAGALFCVLGLVTYREWLAWKGIGDVPYPSDSIWMLGLPGLIALVTGVSLWLKPPKPRRPAVAFGVNARGVWINGLLMRERPEHLPSDRPRVVPRELPCSIPWRDVEFFRVHQPDRSAERNRTLAAVLVAKTAIEVLIFAALRVKIRLPVPAKYTEPYRALVEIGVPSGRMLIDLAEVDIDLDALTTLGRHAMHLHRQRRASVEAGGGGVGDGGGIAMKVSSQRRSQSSEVRSSADVGSSSGA